MVDVQHDDSDVESTESLPDLLPVTADPVVPEHVVGDPLVGSSSAKDVVSGGRGDLQAAGGSNGCQLETESFARLCAASHGTFERDTTVGKIEGRMPMDAFRMHQIGEQGVPITNWDPEPFIPFAKSNRSIPCSDELAEKEFGYPKMPDDMKQPSFFKEELGKMQDPRYNKNLGRSVQDQEFWNEAARVPWAKVLLRREAYWNARKEVWLSQYGRVEKMNKARAQVGDMLEDCTMDIKRLVAPMLKYKVVEHMLENAVGHAEEMGMSFQEYLQNPDVLTILQNARKRLDAGGEVEAQYIQDQFDVYAKKASEVLQDILENEEKERGRILMDMQGLKVALDFGTKCKKDGVLESQKGNWDEALVSWRQGDQVLRKFRAPDHRIEENEMIMELHSAVLKNLAQAAIKLGHWSEAIDAADRVLEMNDEDHKAWFRKACALEGLGRFSEARTCLEKVEDVAVGRPDRDRIEKDITQRRTKLEDVEARQKKDHERMIQQGLQQQIFSADRATAPPAFTLESHSEGCGGDTVSLPAAQLEDNYDANSIIQARMAFRGSSVQKVTRRKITRDGAWDLLDSLETAYQDPGFIAQVDKLIQDVHFDSKQFMLNLNKVSLPIQRPILEKWGFEASPQGVEEMMKAIQDHSHGPGSDAKLRTRWNEVQKQLYGSGELRMYDRMCGNS